MDSLEKMLKLLSALDANKLLVRQAARIELKRTRSGHYRLWLGFPEGITKPEADAADPLLVGQGITANPFGKGGRYGAVTFVDDNEDAD